MNGECTGFGTPADMSYQPPAGGEEATHYSQTVYVDGERVSTTALADPLTHTTVVVERRDLWRALLRGRLTVRVVTSADRVGLWRLFSSHRWEPPGLLDQAPPTPRLPDPGRGVER